MGLISEMRPRSSKMCHGFYLLVFIFILFKVQNVSGRGFFELEIIEVTNYRGELASGKCCGGIIHTKPCPFECHTYFRVCLKEYQINVTSIGSCSFGNTSSPVLGGNSFRLADPESAHGKLVLPFSFSWTGTAVVQLRRGLLEVKQQREWLVFGWVTVTPLPTPSPPKRHPSMRYRRTDPPSY